MVVVERETDSSATTVFIAVMILLVIGLAFYFGFRNSPGIPNTGSDMNVDVNLPVDTGGNGGAEKGY